MAFIFPYIGKNHSNWRTHIFQRGRYTTNQKWWSLSVMFNVPWLQQKWGTSQLRRGYGRYQWHRLRIWPTAQYTGSQRSSQSWTEGSKVIAIPFPFDPVERIKPPGSPWNARIVCRWSCDSDSYVRKLPWNHVCRIWNLWRIQTAKWNYNVVTSVITPNGGWFQSHLFHPISGQQLRMVKNIFIAFFRITDWKHPDLGLKSGHGNQLWGQTGSGKTFTITGGRMLQGSPGVWRMVQRCADMADTPESKRPLGGIGKALPERYNARWCLMMLEMCVLKTRCVESRPMFFRAGRCTAAGHS